MLNNITVIFDDKDLMMKKLKKKSYEVNFESFRGQFGFYFKEMAEHIAGSEDKEAGAKEVAKCFCDQVGTVFKNGRGRIPSRTQADMNMFMIYYVFPLIIKTDAENGTLMCDMLVAQWNSDFKQHMGYADYDQIHDSFREKIFGIF